MPEFPQPDPPAPGRRRAGRPRLEPVPRPLPDMGALVAGPVLPPDPRAAAASIARSGLAPRQKEYLLSLLAEKRKRQFESLRLFEPLPTQSQFLTSMARQRIARGSNRSGKTTCTCVELAWAATGTHPQPGKYPLRDGLAIVVAKDLDKIGEVIWRKLGRAGAFKIVHDPAVGWRAERPGDAALGLKAKPAPPLIPPRFIKEIAWESKKSNIPKKVILHTGWEISFYSSKSDPFSIQGTQLDLVLFDEEIVHKDWYPEATARLLDRMGRFMWGATPQTGTQQLFDLHLRAEASVEEKEESPLVEEVFLSLWDNPHIDDQAKADFVESLDEEERRVRIEGEFAISGLRVYEGRFFPRTTHAVEAFDIPDHWTRFAAIDPGAQVGAVLFAAVPPKRPDDPALDPALFGDHVYLYDEIFIRGCDAAKLAAKMKQVIGGQRIHAFLIDAHGGRLREIGSGKLPEQQYKEAFRAAKVGCETTGHGFTWGSDDLDGGILRVKEFLRTRDDGTPKLRVLRGRCPHFIKQMSRYQWKVVNGEVTEKPLARGCDMADCVRYLCQHAGLKYVAAKAVPARTGGAYDAYIRGKERRASRDRASRGTGVTLG